LIDLGSASTSSLYEAGVCWQLGHDGVTEGSGWFVKEVEVDTPTKGKRYFFKCDSWLDRDRGDGQTTRTFSLDEGEASVVGYQKRAFICSLPVYIGSLAAWLNSVVVRALNIRLTGPGSVLTHCAGEHGPVKAARNTHHQTAIYGVAQKSKPLSRIIIKSY